MPICTCNSAQHQYSLRKCKFKPLWNTTPTVDVLSCSAMSDFLWPHGLQPTRLLHLWNFPDKNTGVGFHLLLQGMFLTKRSNPLLLDLLHWQADSLSLCHLQWLKISKTGITKCWKGCRTNIAGGNIKWNSWVKCLQFLIKSNHKPNLYPENSWGRWGSDTTERLHFHFSLSCVGEGNGNPLQCSCLQSPRDRGAWWAAVYGVAQSWTRLKWLSSSSK